MFIQSDNSTRIAKNTIFLYVRMFFLTVVSLYTSREILYLLGVEDYGIYAVVGGVIGLFTFLSHSMVTATQRFLNFEMPIGDSGLKEVFSCSISIHIILGLLVVFLCETFGLWALYHKIVIPEERFPIAVWIFHLSVVSVFFSIMTFPYNAVLISREQMGVYAWISIIEAFIKLLAVLVLFVLPFDRLILYAFMMLGSQLLVNTIYIWYCRRHFHEARVRLCFQGNKFREMIVFASWDLFGNVASVACTQGLDILLNFYYGPVLNAARSVARTVVVTLGNFSNNFQVAVNPQITKSYSEGNLDYMYKLMCSSAKFSFVLLLLIALPFLFEIPYILSLWLVEVPPYTVIFIRLSLITSLFNLLGTPFWIAASSTGNIRRFEIISNGILFSSLPLSYMFLCYGGKPYVVYIVLLIIVILKVISQIMITSNQIGFSKRLFVRKVVYKIVIILLLSLPLPLVFLKYMDEGIMRLGIVSVMTIISILTLTYVLGLEDYEKSLVNAKIAEIHKKSNDRALQR